MHYPKTGYQVLRCWCFMGVFYLFLCVWLLLLLLFWGGGFIVVEHMLKQKKESIVGHYSNRNDLCNGFCL